MSVDTIYPPMLAALEEDVGPSKRHKSDRGIAAAIVVQDGAVLMVRRRVAEGQLSWQFPAGEIEGTETPEQAAVRETSEEVGMEVTALKVLGERVHPKTGRKMTYVACVVESPALLTWRTTMNWLRWHGSGMPRFPRTCHTASSTRCRYISTPH